MQGTLEQGHPSQTNGSVPGDWPTEINHLGHRIIVGLIGIFRHMLAHMWLPADQSGDSPGTWECLAALIAMIRQSKFN